MKNNIKNLIIIVAFATIIISCKKHKKNFFIGDITSKIEFKDTLILQEEELNFDDSCMYSLFNLYVKDSIYIGDYVNNQFKFKIYDEKFKLISTLINIGRGENEMLFPKYMGIRNENGSNYIYVSDVNMKGIYKINLDNFIKNKKYDLEKVYDFEVNMFNAKIFGKNKYVILCYNMQDMKMYFEIINNHGKKEGNKIILNNFPFKEIYANTSILFSARPDGEKIAMVSLSMNQIMILDVNKQKNNIYTTDNDIVKWESIENTFLPYDTYISLTTTQENIITAKNIIENEEIKKVLVEIWDWNGNPMKQYIIEKEVKDISFDDKNNILYAISVNDKIYKYVIE